VYSRTTGFRHDAIPGGVTALRSIAASRGWPLDATEDPAAFAPANLARYRVVVFLLTSGDVLDDAQQLAFEQWMRAGGGWVGVHSASDTEYDWPFYGELVGAYFDRHPAGTPRATLLVTDPAHPAVAHLPARWVRDDEWYSFRANPADRPALHPLVVLDEDSFAPAAEFRMGYHPVVWYQYVHGGRGFYTALGHTMASYEDPAFRAMLEGAIGWAAGVAVTPREVLDEFNGTSPNGAWDVHQYQGGGAFEYAPGRDGLGMIAEGRGNQHVTRRGVLLDARRPYAVEALFQIAASRARAFVSPINSFCINFDVQGAAGSATDLSHLYARAINLDLSSDAPGAGVMKWMGFVDGGFRQIGETPTRCCAFERVYRLRVEVNRTLAGALRLGAVTATLSEGRTVHERFEVDFGAFPFQPDRAQPVRVGVNTHDADWVMRDLRVRYLD
jgi:type 1 glutamine amidotransferase